MPRTCWIRGCKVRHKKGIGLKFHLFPKDEVMRKKWIEALEINQGDLRIPTQYANICNKHFTEDDYFLNPYRNKCLKKDAVPSIFPPPPYGPYRNRKKTVWVRILDGTIVSEVNNRVESKSSLTTLNKTVEVPPTSNEFSTKEDINDKENELRMPIPDDFTKSENKKQIVPNSGRLILKEQCSCIAAEKSRVSVEKKSIPQIEDSYYWLKIPDTKNPDVKILGYHFEKMIEEVKHMKLPSSSWRIVIIVQDLKYVSVNFLKKPFPEKVITIHAKNSVCDIIIDHRNIVLVGSPAFINTIEDLEILLDIVDELNLNNPMIGYTS